jgi:predicted metal-dependent hydrolase
MNKIEYNKQSLFYDISYSTKKKIYIRVKNGFVNVSCPKNTSTKYIEELLYKYFDNLLEKVKKTKIQNIIHVNGIGYTPKFFIGKRKGVAIIENEIWITATKNSLDEYKKVLNDFYKEEIAKILPLIIEESKRDFYEIKKFPEVKLRYMKSMFGNYNRKTNIVKLSTILAKYDYMYIKHVLYHELSHVFEMNHSKKFYAVFDNKYPNAKAVRKQFKKIKYYDYI